MAAVPVTLVGKLAARRPGVRVPVRAWAAKAAAAAREHLTTATALAAVDLGCFEAARPAGWIVTGVSLLVFEWKVRE